MNISELDDGNLIRNGVNHANSGWNPVSRARTVEVYDPSDDLRVIDTLIEREMNSSDAVKQCLQKVNGDGDPGEDDIRRAVKW